MIKSLVGYMKKYSYVAYSIKTRNSLEIEKKSMKLQMSIYREVIRLANEDKVRDDILYFDAIYNIRKIILQIRMLNIRLKEVAFA